MEASDLQPNTIDCFPPILAKVVEALGLDFSSIFRLVKTPDLNPFIPPSVFLFWQKIQEPTHRSHLLSRAEPMLPPTTASISGLRFLG